MNQKVKGDYTLSKGRQVVALSVVNGSNGGSAASSLFHFCGGNSRLGITARRLTCFFFFSNLAAPNWRESSRCGPLTRSLTLEPHLKMKYLRCDPLWCLHAEIIPLIIISHTCTHTRQGCRVTFRWVITLRYTAGDFNLRSRTQLPQKAISSSV